MDRSLTCESRWWRYRRGDAWIDGGATDLANAALLCERHHTKVHHGFRVERQPDGRWRTWRPDGTEIRTGPQRTGPPLATVA